MTSPTARDQHFKSISLSGEGRRDNTLHTQTTHTKVHWGKAGHTDNKTPDHRDKQTASSWLSPWDRPATEPPQPEQLPPECPPGKAELPSSTGARILTINNFTTANNICPPRHKAARNHPEHGLAQLSPSTQAAARVIRWAPCACASVTRITFSS